MKKLLNSYLDFTIRRAWLIVLIFVLMTGGTATWLIVFEPLKLDTSFLTLLPQDLPCVKASRESSRLIGSTDNLIIAVESPNVRDNMAFIDEMAERLKDLPEIYWMSVEEDKTFFRDRRLLYLDVPDLKTIVGRAKDRVDYEKKMANPFYVSLDDEKAPDIDFDDIMDKYEERLRTRGATNVVSKPEAGMAQNGKATIDLGDRYAQRHGEVQSLMARPVKPASDMTFTNALVEKVEKILEESNPHRNPQMRAQIVGSYRNRYDSYHTIVGDIFSSLAVSLSLILAIIIIFFRRVRTVGLIFLPLLGGMTLTVGLTAATIGRLNMTTALIFAVLLGLGIDFGVHIALRYLDERARGKSLHESLSLAIVNTGRAILTAGLTTAGGLAVLIAADFKGFSEFGIIAMMAIILCLVVYILVLPALAVLFEKASVPKPWRKYEDGEIMIAPIKSPPRVFGLALVLVAVATGVGVWGAMGLEFEYDFSNLGTPKDPDAIRYGRSVGGGTSPVVALMPTQEETRKLSRHLESVVDTDNVGLSGIKKTFSLFSFVPDDQDQKMPLLEELNGYVEEALKLKKLKKKTRERLEEIEGWTKVGAITVDGLPDLIKDKFREKDGTLGRMVFIMPRASSNHVREMETFYDRFGRIELADGKEVIPSSSGFILVEVVRAVQRDGWLMTVAATGVVLLCLLVDLRSFKRALFVFLPLLVGLLWCAGLMRLLGIKLGLYNMLVLPTLLGVGIDASIHLYHAYREHGPGSLRHVLTTTGKGIVVAAATTGVGFVGMTIVSHQGLKSIGILAVVGIVATLAGALITLPIMLAFRESLRSRKLSRAGSGGDGLPLTDGGEGQTGSGE